MSGTNRRLAMAQKHWTIGITPFTTAVKNALVARFGLCKNVYELKELGEAEILKTPNFTRKGLEQLRLVWNSIEGNKQ